MFVVLKKLSWFFKLHWKRYTLAVVLLTIVGIMDVLPPKLIGSAIDGIQQGTMTTRGLTELLLFWGGLTVAGYLITCVWWSLLFGSSFMLERTLRSRLMRHFLKMTPTFYERNRTGDLMARATNDLGAVSQTAGFGILTLIDSTLFMLTILVVMAGVISWKLTLAAMLPLPVMALVMQHFGKKIHERFTEQQDAFGELERSGAGIGVGRAGRPRIRAGGGGPGTVQREDGRSVRQKHRGRQDRCGVRADGQNPGRAQLSDRPVLRSVLVFRSEITLGEMVSFNMFLGMLIWPMFAIGELINIMQRGNASLDRINETLGIKPDVKDAAAPVPMPVPESIVFDHVTFRYPSSSIDNLVDVSLHAGQRPDARHRRTDGKRQNDAAEAAASRISHWARRA